MSRASTAKPPALAMPSRRAAVSAGFPVRRRRPDAGDCRHQGEYAGACPFWTGSLFLCLFSFFLLPKGRDLPKHGLRGGLFRIRVGRAGERPRPGRRPQARRAVTRRSVSHGVCPHSGTPWRAGSDAVWCGRLSHGSCRSLWSGKPHAAQGAAVQPVFLRMDGETPSGSRLAERLLPHGAIVSPCAVVPPSSAAGGATGKIFRFFMH